MISTSSFRAARPAKLLSLAVAFFGTTTLAVAQGTSAPVVRLWSGDAPGATGKGPEDIPTLTVYLPKTVTPKMPAIVVAPGGGYGGLATDYEGVEAQEFLNGLGVAVFMLQYRVAPYHHPVELGDAQRAVRTVRARAKEWGIDPARVGFMGFSAGGHLASTISTHFDSGLTKAGADAIDHMSSRPDFAILVYPVVSLVSPWTHQGSKRHLLGDNPDSALARSLSNELMVTSSTPPTFLFHTSGDNEVPPENSVYYYLALRKAGVKAELHIFQNGNHGSALSNPNLRVTTPEQDEPLKAWPGLLANWLRVNGWLPLAQTGT